MKIDGIDKTIIRTLIKDARTPILTIARKVGVSGAAIHQRLRKLEKSGLIESYNMVINPKPLGYNSTAFVGLYIDSSCLLSSMVKRLKEIPEIIESHYTSGNFAVFVKVLCKDNKDLVRVLNEEIQQIKGVLRIETFVSLEQQIKRQIDI